MEGQSLGVEGTRGKGETRPGHGRFGHLSRGARCEYEMILYVPDTIEPSKPTPCGGDKKAAPIKPCPNCSMEIKGL